MTEFNNILEEHLKTLSSFDRIALAQKVLEEDFEYVEVNDITSQAHELLDDARIAEFCENERLSEIIGAREDRENDEDYRARAI